MALGAAASRRGVAPCAGVGVRVAALFVQRDGVYARRELVDVWDVERDARRYAGPWPVVGHPPCERWGRYWSGGPSHHGRFRLGDDAGCFASALASVRRWGGVLEHPADSHAWAAHALIAPPRAGGWVGAGDWMGWSCCVEQGHYGHRARKATWLYAVGVDLPSLRWGSSGTRGRLDEGYHSAQERRARQRRGVVDVMPKSQRAVTPQPFAELLLSMARTVDPSRMARACGSVAR